MQRFAWLGLLLASAVRSSPISTGAFEITARENENIPITTGEPARDRTIFAVLSLLCMMVLAFLLGARVRQLKKSLRVRRNLMSLLLAFMCVVVICYIIASAAMVSGQGLYTYDLCYAGTFVCLVFYVTIKGTVYTFMVERVHVVRAPFVKRSKDKIYLACMAMAGIMYSAISVNAFVFRVTELRSSDGRCHFGIRGIASFPVLAVNLFTNLVLTGVFFYLLRPVVKLHSTSSMSGQSVSQTMRRTFWGPHPNESAVQRNIRTLLWKSIIASLLIEIPMAANMIQFIITKGEELGMICLTICMIDVFWDCLIMYWLTFGSSAEAERSLSLSLASSRDTLRPQESGLDKIETKELDLIKAPGNVHMPQPDFIELHLSRTITPPGTTTSEIPLTDGPVR